MAHERYKVASSETLLTGPAVIRVDFKYDGGASERGDRHALHQ
jgi:arylsulfatase